MDVEAERRLVARSLQGDHASFGELVGAYERVLFNLALRMVNDREDARDLTQSAFLKAYRKLDQFDTSRRFFSWIYRITINESLNLLSRRRPSEPFDELRPSQRPTPEDQMAGQQTEAIIQGALMKLTPGDRQVLILRHFLNYSHLEMSDVLGVPVKTLKSRLHTARQRLAGVLRRQGVTSA